MTQTYPVRRHIVVTSTEVFRLQPAFAPNAVCDPLEAYAPFLHANASEAQASVDEYVEMRREAFEPADNDDAFDPDNETDTILECIIYADGTIETEMGTLTREQVFAAYGMDDPAIRTPRP